MTAIQLSDLNTTINHEPRVRDLMIAERLGLVKPSNIRLVIDANRAELEGFGPLHVANAMVDVGSGAQRQVTEYWLNEGQALVICALSRTPKAAEVRKALIDVYLAYRRGLVPVKAHTRRRQIPAMSDGYRRAKLQQLGEAMLTVLNAANRIEMIAKDLEWVVDCSPLDDGIHNVWRQVKR